VRSFSIARITIQSRSPRMRLARPATSVRRRRATSSTDRLSSSLDFTEVSELRRVDGRGGSCSRRMRWISPKPALRSVRESKGVVPVSSSYSMTPSA
jgi:hypothetical protein